jgi:hypothetical protein
MQGHREGREEKRRGNGQQCSDRTVVIFDSNQFSLPLLLHCSIAVPSHSKVQASLLELRGSLQRAEELLQSGAAASEIDPLLVACRGEMSQIHVDVKDLSQTITIVEEVRGATRHSETARTALWGKLQIDRIPSYFKSYLASALFLSPSCATCLLIPVVHLCCCVLP